jgi:hypothetical protein
LSFEWWKDDDLIETIFQEPYETWKKLTKREKLLIKAFPNDGYIIYKNKTIAFQKTSVFFGNSPGNLNGLGDAYRHAFFQAINTVKLRKYRTKQFADAHESETPLRCIKEKEMDLFNNEVGMDFIEFAHPNWTDIDLIANEILNILINGELRYLSPINYSSPTFWDIPTTSQPNDGDHGILSTTILIPTH